jgi:hypothetical protein
VVDADQSFANLGLRSQYWLSSRNWFPWVAEVNSENTPKEYFLND